jgi:hypothetical protein
MARSRKVTEKPATGKRRIEKCIVLVAVKIVDDRDIESLKIVSVP